MTEKPFTILIVCTGNVCRSPLAEQMLSTAARAALPADLTGQVVIGSAGTEAPIGAPMALPAAEISARVGAHPNGHRARQLTADMVQDADLTLVATRAHRKQIALMVPRSARTLFTIREFGRVASVFAGEQPDPARSAEGLRELVLQTAARRGFQPMLDPSYDDIVDPIGRSEKTYKRMADELVPAVRAASALLFR